jgi:hypothetical protein
MSMSMSMTAGGNGIAPAARPPAPLPPAGLLALRQAPALHAAVLAALPAAQGRAALLLPDHPRLRATALRGPVGTETRCSVLMPEQSLASGPPGSPTICSSPPRRRMAEAILRDAAAMGGGTLLRAAGGTLLLGASEATARRAAAALGTVLGAAAPLPVWRLPRDADAVLAWAAGEVPAPDLPPPPVPASPAALHAALEGLSAETVLRAETIRDAAGGRHGQRLRLSRRSLAVAIGPLAADPDLLAQAMERMAARLRPGLAAWACDLPGLRLVPLARDALPAPALRPGAVGVLPLAAAAGPDFAGFQAGLAERGWAVALEGLEAATLALIDPAALPAAHLLLRWSPALAAPELTERLRAIGPARLVLEAGTDPAALAFARAGGLLRTGPA